MSSYKVDRNKWSTLTFFEQMGNISSEVGRSIKWTKAGKEERAQGALERALDLFDATTECLAKTNGARLREVLRAKEEYLRLFYDGTFDSDADAIERYFNQFAVAARIQQAKL